MYTKTQKPVRTPSHCVMVIDRVLRGGARRRGFEGETRAGTGRRHTSTRRSREDSTTHRTESFESFESRRSSESCENADPMARTTTGGRRRARDDGCRRAMAVGALVALGAVAGGRSVSAEKISTLVGNYVTSTATETETLGAGTNAATSAERARPRRRGGAHHRRASHVHGNGR